MRSPEPNPLEQAAPHSGRLQFLLSFFLPVALTLILGTGFHSLALNYLAEQQDATLQSQSHDLKDLAELARIHLEVQQLHQDVMEVVLRSRQAPLLPAEGNELRQRVDMQGEALERALKRVGEEHVGEHLSQELSRASKHFHEQARLLSQAIRLAATEPAQAQELLQEAHAQYVHFSEHMGGIDVLVSARATTQMTSLKDQLVVFRLRLSRLEGGATILLILGWLAVSWFLARNLALLGTSLNQLASGAFLPDTSEDARTIRRLAVRTDSLVGLLARAVLALQDALHSRQATAQALQIERLQLETLLQAMPDLVWLKDATGVYRRCNQRYLQYHGKSSDHILGRRDEDLYPPDRTALNHRSDAQAIQDGYVTLPAMDVVFADGHHESLVVIKTAVYDEDQHLIGVLGVGRDISAVSKAESALRDREQLFYALANQAPSGIMLIELPSLRFIEFNDEACRSLGYTREEFSALTVLDIQGGHSPEQVRRTISSLTEEHPESFENVHRLKDGTVRDFAVSIKSIRLAGQPRLAAVWTDITERKAVERELVRYREALEQRVVERTAALEEVRLHLQAANDELQTIFDSATVGITLVQDRKVLRCNRRMEEILGWPSGGLNGQSTRVWYQDDATYERVGREIVSGLSGSAPFVFDLTLVRADGSSVWCRLSGRRFVTATIPDGLIAMVEDISEEHLAAEVLREGKALAEEASRAKSAFLANMSHEIRTPMNAILGLTHLLKRDTSSPRQLQQLDKVAHAAQHLLGIINDILDFSKIEAGKMTLSPTDFDLERVIGNLCALVLQRVEAKGLELVMDIAGVPPFLHGDGMRLGQVLLNFVSNAVKFTERGSVLLRARTLREEGAQLWVRFEVKDTGIGIAPEQARRLFQPFEQADASTTRTYGGTGLGLAISRRLAELMGGTVGVSTLLGVGSTFYLEVPLSVQPSVPRRTTGMLLPKGTRALVVDDMEEARESITDILTRQGLRADAVPSGEDALHQLSAADALGDPYVLVVMDWRMGGMDGIETGQRLLELPLSVRPVSLLCSGTSGCPKDLLDSAGFYAFIAKPLTPAILQSALAEAFEVPEEPGEVAPPEDLAHLRFRPGLRVLLAEDNDLNQEVALELLSHVGLTPILVGDGQQAVHACQDQVFDLVLMDIQMPVMDGLEATRQIRRLPGFEATPILAMTANAFEEDRASALAAGLSDHVAKPVDPERLYRTLLKWLPLDAASSGHFRTSHAMVKPSPVRREARALLEQVDGLDVEVALKPLRGDVERLVRFLRRFAKDHIRDVRDIRDALAQGTYITAMRYAHTLKSVAGTFGLQRIQGLSKRVEQKLGQREERSSLEPQLNELETELYLTCQQLERVLKAEVSQPIPDENSAESLPLPPLLAPLEKLQALLERDELEAADVFAELREHLHRLSPEMAGMIQSRIEDFAFDEALAPLTMLIAKVRALEPTGTDSV